MCNHVASILMACDTKNNGPQEVDDQPSASESNGVVLDTPLGVPPDICVVDTPDEARRIVQLISSKYSNMCFACDTEVSLSARCCQACQAVQLLFAAHCMLIKSKLSYKLSGQLPQLTMQFLNVKT